MNDDRLSILIETDGTGWLPGPAHGSRWRGCPACGADTVENGSYAGQRACWVVTRCRTCGYAKTLAWAE